MDLKDYREQLDKLDDEMVRLFTQRMELCAKIADYKKKNGLPVLDVRREREKLMDISEKTKPELRDYATSLYSSS